MFRSHSSITLAVRLSLATAALSLTAALAGCADEPTLPGASTRHTSPVGPSLSASVGNVSADPASITFPGTLWHYSREDTVTITNAGSDTAKITSIAITEPNNGVNFTIYPINGGYGDPPDCSWLIAPRATCIIGVRYTAMDIAQVWGSLDISLPSGVISVKLAGEGLFPALLYGPDSISFVDRTVGTTSAAQTVMIRNIGTSDMYVANIKLQGSNPGDFVVVPPSTNACAKGVPIVPNASCDIGVAFAPTAAGPRSGELAVQTMNEVGYASGLATVLLDGKGTEIISTPAADLAVSFGAVPNQVQVGKTLTYPITVKNGGPGAASGIALTAAVPVGTGFAGITVPNGVSCSAPAAGDTGGVFCSITSMASGAAYTVQLSVKTLSGRMVISNTAKVSSASSDPVSGNNSATATTTVVGRK